MSKYERVVRIDGLDPATGVFQATLATEGEASDGHILAIKGIRVPARLPLLPSHWNDPTVVLGSLTNPQKALGEKPPRLRMNGQIEMGGAGAPQELRQDLLHMISQGHVTGMSIRWDEVEGKPPVRRINLPSDHPFFVDAEKAKGEKRWGLYFEHSQALEGSIVALGADKQALIGRAEATEGALSTFYRSMSEHTEPDEVLPPPDPTFEALRSQIDSDNAEGLAAKIDAEFMADDAGKIPAALAAVRIHLTDCREAGASDEEIRSAFEEGMGHPPSVPEANDTEELAALRRCHGEVEQANVDLIEKTADLNTRLDAETQRADAAESALEEGRVSGDPPPSPIEERVPKADPLSASKPLDAVEKRLAETNPHLQAKILRRERERGVLPLDLMRLLQAGLAEDRRKAHARFLERVETARGKVSD